MAKETRVLTPDNPQNYYLRALEILDSEADTVSPQVETRRGGKYLALLQTPHERFITGLTLENEQALYSQFHGDPRAVRNAIARFWEATRRGTVDYATALGLIPVARQDRSAMRGKLTLANTGNMSTLVIAGGGNQYAPDSVRFDDPIQPQIQQGSLRFSGGDIYDTKHPRTPLGANISYNRLYIRQAQGPGTPSSELEFPRAIINQTPRPGIEGVIIYEVRPDDPAYPFNPQLGTSQIFNAWVQPSIVDVFAGQGKGLNPDAIKRGVVGGTNLLRGEILGR